MPMIHSKDHIQKISLLSSFYMSCTQQQWQFWHAYINDSALLMNGVRFGKQTKLPSKWASIAYIVCASSIIVFIAGRDRFASVNRHGVNSTGTDTANSYRPSATQTESYCALLVTAIRLVYVADCHPCTMLQIFLFLEEIVHL